MAKKIGLYSLTKKCGKTISTAFLAESFATLGTNVLVLDLNSDKNFEVLLGFEHPENLKSDIKTVKISQSSWKYLKINENTANLDSEFENFDQEYDYIFVDFPSYDSSFNSDILKKLNSIIIPVECEYYGIDELDKTIEKIIEIENLKIEGILLTKFNKDNQLMPKFIEFIRENFEGMVLETIIARNYYLGLPKFTIENLNHFIPNIGYADYLKLANELKK
ncbi:ParA family protein [Lacihabitans sp. LS3-19]|uniref:ParA family protein n=1 Tax=Lacihabitans sp. LS3-19 TaxID=2487335 RepID=UPI0020CC2882|nr:ParA family protein [Lacihabitans sp. LS3-19]MCP9768205.1 ParA family protein [Lacihabitans sp. LS3-19]